MTSLQNLTVQNPVTQQTPGTQPNHLVTLAQIQALLAALFQGQWNASTSYGQGVIAASGGALWQSLIQVNKGNPPATSPAAWTFLIAAPGSNGLADLHIQVVAGGTATLTATLGANLTGVTVNFVFERVTPTSPTANGYQIDLTQQAQQTRTATIVNAATGQASYQLTATDTAQPGIYRGQFQFTSGNQHQIYPAEGWIEFEVVVAAASATGQLYIGYASDANGANFSTVPNNSLTYVAFKYSTTPLTPVATDFAGLWVRFQGLAGQAGQAGQSGVSNYVYLAWSSDTSGTNFSLAPAGNLPYMAVLNSPVQISSPTAANFAGLWFNVQGPPGQNGQSGQSGQNGSSSFTYVAWASDTNGTAFSMTPAAGLNYMGVLVSPTAIPALTAANFAGTWFSVQGPQGAAGTPGTNGTNGTSVYYYAGYASDANGTNYSTSPSTGLNYIAIKLSSTPINPVNTGTFAGLWVQYAINPPPSVPTTTDQLNEGTRNLYFTSARVLSVLLAGISGTITGAVTATDSILSAFGKLQNRLATVEAAMQSPGQALYSEGTIAVTQDASSGTVNNLSLSFTPSRVLLTVNIPAAGSMLFAVCVGVPNTTGFSWQLSAAAPAAGYKIFYRIT